MTSDRQIAANRANAAHSTGPKTPEGKKFSSFNALQHGLYARDVVLPGEDREAYDSLQEHLGNDLSPVGRTEQGLIKRLADIWWRLDRTAGIEAGLLNPDWSADDRFAMNIPLVDVYRIAIDNTPTLDRLGRYEGRLERALARTLHLLSTMQAARRRNTRRNAKSNGRRTAP